MSQEVVIDAGEGTELGRAFAAALARKDFEAVRALLSPHVEFRALTPRRSWEADDPSSVIDDVLRRWFKEDDTIEEIATIETDAFSDRRRVSYRFHGHNPDGPFVLEQQAYYRESDGRIEWMRVLCSGYRPR